MGIGDGPSRTPLSGVTASIVLVALLAAIFVMFARADEGLKVSGTEETSPAADVPNASPATTTVPPIDSTISPSPSYQPLPPITATFFYPWFPEAWTQRGTMQYTNFEPSMGFYESTDPAVVDQQMELASSAGVEAFIASWWGPGHYTDESLQAIFSSSIGIDSVAPDLRWAVYYEEEGQSDPEVADLVADLKYLARTFFDNPAYLRVDGRPVVFVWATGYEPDMTARWARAKEQLNDDLYVVLKVYSGYRDSMDQPDSWHQYAPASGYHEQLPYSVTVSPGFHKVGENPRLDRDVDRFANDVARMVASGATWQLVTSWNEWGEGTAIEPAEEWGTAYLDVLAEHSPVSRTSDS